MEPAENMRIGLIAPPWLPIPPTAYGGIEAFVDILARALRAGGHDVVLAASGDSTTPVERLPGFPRSDPQLLGTSVMELRHVSRAYGLLGDVDVDVVHDNTLIGPHLRARASGVPVITTAHGPFVPELLDIFRALPADVSTVAISAHQASMAAGIPIARVIHHGIDADRIPFGPGDGGYACFLGRMSPDKGVREAIAICHTAGIRLVIAAKMREPAERAYFESAVRPFLGASVEFIGELSTAEKFDLLGRAVALVNPVAWDEPFGMVMIESLAVGTPVVGTPRGAVPEIVDDGVTGFVRSSTAELATALARAGELDRQACREVAEGRLSARRMAESYLELYAEVVGSPPRAL